MTYWKELKRIGILNPFIWGITLTCWLLFGIAWNLQGLDDWWLALPFGLVPQTLIVTGGFISYIVKKYRR